MLFLSCSVSEPVQVFGDKKAKHCCKFMSGRDTRWLVPLSAIVSEPTDLLSAVLQHADETDTAIRHLGSRKVSRFSFLVWGTCYVGYSVVLLLRLCFHSRGINCRDDDSSSFQWQCWPGSPINRR
jgi:hypothetical protein